jgi:hypothetical protein
MGSFENNNEPVMYVIKSCALLANEAGIGVNMFDSHFFDLSLFVNFVNR